MPSIFTTRIRLTKQATGENLNQWGAILNSGVFDLVDFAIAGVQTIAVSASNVVLTTAEGTTDEARAAVLKVQGALAANVNIIAPNLQKTYIVSNNTSGAFTLGIKTASGTAVVIPQGSAAQVFCDGNDVFRIVGVTDTTATNALIDAKITEHNNSTSAHYPATSTQRGFVRLSTTPENVAGTAQDAVPTVASVKQIILDIFFPVGTVYATESASFNPNTAWGGTWSVYAQGRCLVGQDTTQTEFDALGETGGAKTHTLTIAQMPAHTHTYVDQNTNNNPVNSGSNDRASTDSVSRTTGSTGGTQPHNNLQPYIVVKFWKRTA